MIGVSFDSIQVGEIFSLKSETFAPCVKVSSCTARDIESNGRPKGFPFNAIILGIKVPMNFHSNTKVFKVNTDLSEDSLTVKLKTNDTWEFKQLD
jgi:hypothetical protein